MEIRISYSQSQLESAVEFISQNNQVFLGKDAEILNTIREYMLKLAKDPECSYVGIMGFTLIADREFESMDSDENVCRIEICVDPSLHLMDELDEDDFRDQVVNLPIESLYKSN